MGRKVGPVGEAITELVLSFLLAASVVYLGIDFIILSKTNNSDESDILTNETNVENTSLANWMDMNDSLIESESISDPSEFNNWNKYINSTLQTRYTYDEDLCKIDRNTAFILSIVYLVIGIIYVCYFPILIYTAVYFSRRQHTTTREPLLKSAYEILIIVSTLSLLLVGVFSIPVIVCAHGFQVYHYIIFFYHFGISGFLGWITVLRRIITILKSSL